MNILRNFLLVAFATIALIASAKVNVGIEVIPQLSTRLSWSAGVNLEIPVNNKMYLSTGISYSTRNRYFDSLIETMEYHPEGDIPADYEKISMNVHADYINIPVLVGYQGTLGSNNVIKVAGGLYYAYCLGGKSKLKMDNNGDVSQETMPSLVTVINNRSDVGLCVEVKYLFLRHFQVGLNIQHGLVKLYQGFTMPGLNDSMIAHNLTPGVKFHQSIGLSLGYVF